MHNTQNVRENEKPQLDKIDQKTWNGNSISPHNFNYMKIENRIKWTTNEPEIKNLDSTIMKMN